MTMLSGQIETAQRSVRTDAYQMSIGELVSMYEEGELIVDPEFQRLFRWEAGQKSKLIESLLLGIPLPSIFVFEKDDGKWELVDGLQRLSTILEFMGKLREPTGELRQPSVLEATRYLPALHNVVWQESDQIPDLPVDQQSALDRVEQLSIRRARLGVEILKRPSDEATKFDLFQRLNAGGTEANAQEVRNSIVLMVNANYFRAIRDAAENPVFKRVSGVSEDQEQKQRHVELAMRFLVHTFVPYDGRLDVEEYIDEGSIVLAREGNYVRDAATIEKSFGLLDQAAGNDALRRYTNGRHSGKIGLVALEVIAVGVGKNLEAILQQPDPVAFVKSRMIGFWEQPGLSTYTSGMRGTTRIQRTVPSGAEWFRP